MKKKIIIGLVILLVGIQLIRVDKTNPPIDSNKDFVSLVKPPVEIGSLLKTACYDCHSNETSYPWYFDVAPISWWAKDHVNDGRKHLNFSIWGDYKEERKAHKLDEMLGEVNEGEMPLSSYTLVHTEAKLTLEQKEALVAWLRTMK
ncbi:heme-binding domain-containing protein [uncultured Cytophaga sp.]|uniref:heme-binding domain-containing protein n=1 Tax=uncultured Cytophaga sp. TaxID=160238 RepID=UPI00260563C5|nr:heme-binding domain-containing protein [uncultured Cytophaga sp.]